MKSLLISVLTLMSSAAMATAEADQATCDAYLESLQGKHLAAHALKVEQALRETLLEAYTEAGLQLEPGQISVAIERSDLTAPTEDDEFSLITTRLLATVSAGRDSIEAVAHAEAEVMPWVDAERVAETDPLGRVIKSELHCSVEMWATNVEITNKATGHEIGTYYFEPSTEEIILP